MKKQYYWILLGVLGIFLFCGFIWAKSLASPSYFMEKEYDKNSDTVEYESHVQDSNDLTSGSGSGNTIVRTTVNGDNNIINSQFDADYVTSISDMVSTMISISIMLVVMSFLFGLIKTIFSYRGL